jgi:outer membrane protein assembly factor BamA
MNIKLFLLVATVTAALPVQATTFFLERIDVRSNRPASVEVVRAESRLRVGESYTEAQLRDAESRVRRLPFVLDVEFSLEKGSTRDTHVLVMRVEEAAPIFVGVEHLLWGTFEDANPSTVRDTRVDAGARLFVGSYGQFHGSVGTSHERDIAHAAVGYTHYNLLDRNIFFSINVGRSLEGDVETWSPEVILGVPVRGNHALRLTIQGAEQSVRTEFPQDTKFLDGGLAWIYDTRNDALFPTEGARWALEVSASRSVTSPKGSHEGVDEWRHEMEVVRLSARRYWPVRTLDAVYLEAASGALVYRQTGANRGESYGLSLQPGYSGSIWGLDRTRRRGDLRFETALLMRATEATPLFLGAVPENLPSETILDAAFVGSVAYRSRWGLVRFNLFWWLASDTYN